MADMMYRLVLRAKFENQEELQRVVNGLEQLKVQGANVSVTMGKTATSTGIGLDKIARSAMSVGFMYNMLESAAMRAQMATMLLDSAQERYNNTIEKYGVNSREAARAARELEQRTEYLNAANMRANVSTALMITNLMLQTGVLNAATRAEIIKTTATIAATAKEWLHVAALKARAVWQAIVSGGAAIPFMIGAGVTMAGIGGYMIATAAPEKPTINIETKVEVTGTDIDTALDKQNKQVKRELDSMGVK